jgi:flagellar basal body rod protein FlgG
MFFDPAMSAALERIAERAQDVQRAFVPGAIAQHDDVATSSDRSQPSLDTLCIALPNDAYLIASNAPNERSYTRDGALHLADDVLVDATGTPILGERGPNEPMEELRVDSVDAALGRVALPRVEADGTFAYTRSAIDPRSLTRVSSRVVVGRVALARFPAGTKLVGDGTHASAPPGVTPHTGFAGDASFARLKPMQRQSSGIDLDRSLIRLKEAYLAFDALHAAEQAKGRLGKTAMDLVK